MELGIALQSWGKPDAPPGTPDQMEAKRVVPMVPVPKVPLRKMTMLASGIGTKNLGEAIRGGSAVKHGKHPKTGQPLQWRKQWFKDAAGCWKWEWEQVEESKASGTKDSKAPPAKAPPVLPPAAKEKAAADKAAEEEAAADKAAEEKAAADKAAEEKAAADKAADLKALQEAAAGQAPSTWPPMPSLIVPSSSSSSSAGYGGSSVSSDDITRFITVFLAAARGAPPPRSGPTIIDLTPTLTPGVKTKAMPPTPPWHRTRSRASKWHPQRATES